MGLIVSSLFLYLVIYMSYGGPKRFLATNTLANFFDGDVRVLTS